MDTNYNRRDFLKASAAGVGSMGLAAMTTAKKARAEETSSGNKTLRIGFVGVGDQGSYHLDCALGIEGVEVPALCDIDNAYLYRAKRWVEESDRPTPRLYGKTKTDFVRMCENEELDVVICATSWKWHVPICLAAMKTGKNAVSEVPMVQTVDEAWELVETYESTGKWATLGFKGVHSALSNMIHKGLFGDIIHCESGYVHDLRLVKFDPEREPWRLQHSINRNGNLYPDHPTCRVIPYMNINHGDRFDYLVSMSSNSRGLKLFAAEMFGPDHPKATRDYANGDVNFSLIKTVNGLTIVLGHDCDTPRPYSRINLVQGTKGIFRGYPDEIIYIENRSPKAHTWEPFKDYKKEYEHPLWKKLGERGKAARHGSMDYIEDYRLIECLRTGIPTDMDVYDAASWSVVSGLSEWSVAHKSRPIDFPDFTRGKWKTRPPLGIIGV